MEYYQQNANGQPFDYETQYRREQEKKAVKRTSLAVGLSIIVYFAASLVLPTVLSPIVSLILSAAKTLEVYEAVYQLYIGFVYFLPLALSVIPICLLVKIPLRVAVPMRKTRFSTLSAGVMVGLGSSTVGIAVAAVVLTIISILGFEYNLPEQPNPTTAVGIVLSLINVALLPAILEEVVFRGFIMQSLRRFGDLFAIVISAMVFALFHGNFAQLPNAFILGMVIGFFTVRTGSLLTGMLIHFFNNLILSAVDVFVTPYLSEPMQVVLSAGLMLVYLVLGIIGIVIIVSGTKGFFTLKKSDSPLTAGELSKYLFLSPVMLIGILIAALFCLMFLV